MFNLYGPVNMHPYQSEGPTYIIHYLPSDKALYTFVSNLLSRYEELLNGTAGWYYSLTNIQPHPPLYCAFNTLDDIPEFFI